MYTSQDGEVEYRQVGLHSQLIVGKVCSADEKDSFC